MNHRERIREIDDTHDTKVDMPIDYREAETIDEENLYHNGGVSDSFFLYSHQIETIDIEISNSY